MKFVIRRTPLGFETYLWVEGALADLRDLMSQVETAHPLALRPRPRPHKLVLYADMALREATTVGSAED
jgi:hypothetical protein